MMVDRLVQYRLLLYTLPLPCSRVTMSEVIETYALLCSVLDATVSEKREEIQKQITECEHLVERMFLRQFGKDLTDLL